MSVATRNGKAPRPTPPPAAPACERAAVGAALDGRVQEVRARIQPSHLTDGNVRTVLSAAYLLQDEERPVSVATVADYLRNQEKLDALGGKAFLNELWSEGRGLNGTLDGHLLEVVQAAEQRDERVRLAAISAQIQAITAELAAGDTSRLGELQTLTAQAASAKRGKVRRGIRLSELQQKEFPEKKWAVPNVIPRGVTLYLGAEKIGKSLLCASVGYAIASGGMALGSIPVEQGEVLYVSMEDGEYRTKDRVQKMVGNEEAWPHGYDLHTEWPTTDQGGLEALEDYLQEYPNCRFVVFDTMTVIRPEQKKGADKYREDTDFIRSLKRIADRYEDRNLAIVLIHHTSKADVEDDWTKAASGTRGLSAAADATLMLERKRGEKVARLRMTGRDVDDSTPLGLVFDPTRLLWSTTDTPPDFEVTNEKKRAILDYLLSRPDGLPTAVADIAVATGIGGTTVRPYCLQLAKCNILANHEGRFSVTESYRNHLERGTPHQPEPCREPSPFVDEAPLPEPPPETGRVVHLFTEPEPLVAELALPPTLPPPEDDLRRRTWARAMRHRFPEDVDVGGYRSEPGEAWWRYLCEQSGPEYVQAANEALKTWGKGADDG